MMMSIERLLIIGNSCQTLFQSDVNPIDKERLSYKDQVFNRAYGEFNLQPIDS